jgi:hypothetical protein
MFLMCVIRLDNSNVQVFFRSCGSQTSLGTGQAKVVILSHEVPNLRVIARIQYKIKSTLNGRYTCIIRFTLSPPTTHEALRIAADGACDRGCCCHGKQAPLA